MTLDQKLRRAAADAHSAVGDVAVPTLERPQRGWTVAVAAVVLLLFMVGVAWWVSAPGDDSPPVITQVPDPQPSGEPFPDESALYAVASSDGRLVAVGTDHHGGFGAVPSADASAAVWTSSDGAAWTPVPHDESVFGGPGGQVMWGITAIDGGFVAVGVDGRDPNLGNSPDFTPQVAAVWTSPDGLSWSRVPHDEQVLGGPGQQEMWSLAATGSRLVAVGFDEEGPMGGSQENTALWISEDGVVWSQVPSGFGRGVMESVIATESGFLGFGSENGRVVWESVDGENWTLLPGRGPDAPPWELRSVIEVDDGYVGVARDTGLWRSDDGLTWTQDNTGPGFPGGIIRGIVPFQTGIIAVGLAGPSDNFRAEAGPLPLIGENAGAAPTTDTGLISPNNWTLAATSFSDSNVVITDLVEDLRATAGVVDVVQIPPTWEAWNAVTGLDGMCVVEGGPLPCREGLAVLLDDPGGASLVAEQLMDLPVVMSEPASRKLIEDYIRAMSETPNSPEPRFDTTNLGVERPLVEDLELTAWSGILPELTQGELLWQVAVQPVGSRLAGVFSIERQPPSYGLTTYMLSIQVGQADEGPSRGSGGLVGFGPLGLVTSGIAEGARIIGGLPPEASIVAVRFADGTGIWQRPVRGVAMFEPPHTEVVVLDQNGEELLTIRGN